MKSVISNKNQVCLILDNIRSVHNTGSIFRTAETVGVAKIYCVGTTPVPLDRFGRKRGDFAKVSLGAEDMVPWEHCENGIALVKKLKKEGSDIVALEQDENSTDYRSYKLREKTALILGNEVGGVDAKLLRLADSIIEIPMQGKKESLNVAVAAGIVLFRLVQR